MDPTVGRIVHYRLTEEDVNTINIRRENARFISYGNPHSKGQVLPMIICAVYPYEFGDRPGVNGQVFLDGNDSLWVASALEGTEPGQWSWPEKRVTKEESSAAAREFDKIYATDAALLDTLKLLAETNDKVSILEVAVARLEKGIPNAVLPG